MKRFLTIVLACLAIASASYAQKKPKAPKIGLAETKWKAGSYAEAKDIVDAGITDERTMTDSKTWFIRGLVYASLDTTTNEEYANLVENPFEIALEAFAKAQELKKGAGENFTTVAIPGNPIAMVQAQTLILEEHLWGHYLRKGAAYFDEGNYESALINLEKSQALKPTDTTSFIYGGVVALADEKNEKALKDFQKYIENGGNDILAYERIIYIIADLNQDDEGALKFVKESREKFPRAGSLSEWEFKLLYRLNRLEEAKEEIKKRIESDPNNPELHFNLGVMNQATEDDNEALKNYEKAIEVDPEYYNAYFNIGIIKRDLLVKASKEKNNLGVSRGELAQAEKLQVEIEKISKTAIPYWEKCNAMSPNNQDILQTLLFLYGQIKDYDKAEKIQDQLEELGFK